MVVVTSGGWCLVSVGWWLVVGGWLVGGWLWWWVVVVVTSGGWCLVSVGWWVVGGWWLVVVGGSGGMEEGTICSSLTLNWEGTKA